MAEDKTSPDKLCFVVSPIGAPGGPERTHADWLLKGIIEPVFDQGFRNFRIERADKINVPGMIDSQVINHLLDADLVIADMSLLNANAFYEMGIRHMKQKPIIHMYKIGETIPFDVAPHRAIPFSYAHPDDLKAAQQALRAAVVEVLKPDFQVENPVTRARGVLRLEEHATPELRVLFDQLEALQSEMEHMRVSQEIAARASGSLMLDEAGFIARDEYLRNQVAHRGMVVLPARIVWQFLVDIAEPSKVDEIAPAILKLKPKASIFMRSDSKLEVSTTGSGRQVRHFMDEIMKIKGVVAVHSAEQKT